MSAHDFELEQTALLAAGFLNERDSVTAREHLQQCSACASEFRELADTAARIGLIAQIESHVHELRLARVKKRLLNEIARADAQLIDPLARSAQAATQRLLLGYQALAALACFGALCAGFYAFSMHQRADIADNTFATLRSQLDQSEAAEEHQRAASDLLLRKQRRLYALDRGALIVQKQKIILALTLLPSLPQDRVFQAWTQRQNDKTLQADRIFSARADEPTLVELAQSPQNVKIVAVTIEPLNGSSHPTSRPLFLQKL